MGVSGWNFSKLIFISIWNEISGVIHSVSLSYLIIQMTIELKQCFFDCILVKPRCVWEIADDSMWYISTQKSFKTNIFEVLLMILLCPTTKYPYTTYNKSALMDWFCLIDHVFNVVKKKIPKTWWWAWFSFFSTKSAIFLVIFFKKKT